MTTTEIKTHYYQQYVDESKTDIINPLRDIEALGYLQCVMLLAPTLKEWAEGEATIKMIKILTESIKRGDK